MSRDKFILVASSTAAVVFWGLTAIILFTPSMQGGGRMILAAVLAGTATIIAALYRFLAAFHRFERRREERDRDRTLLITTLADTVVPGRRRQPPTLPMPVRRFPRAL
jgi:hypothetical protein